MPLRSIKYLVNSYGLFYNMAIGNAAEGILMHAADKPSRARIPEAVTLTILVIVDTLLDAMGFKSMKPQLIHPQVWLLAVVIISFVLAEPWVMKTYAAVQANTTARSTIPPRILKHWEETRAAFGIDLNEERADITQFPSILEQIKQAEAARLSCSDPATQDALNERITILMRETLGPLAAELAYLREAGKLQFEVLDLLDPQQPTQDAAAALLARSPF